MNGALSQVTPEEGARVLRAVAQGHPPADVWRPIMKRHAARLGAALEAERAALRRRWNA